MRQSAHSSTHIVSPLLIWSAFIIPQIIWAAAGPVIKLTLNYIPSIEFLFYRFAITCLVILPIVLFELKRTKINNKDWVTLIVLGILGYGSMLFLFEGFRYTTAIDAAIIGVIAPIIQAVAGNYFYKEKISLKYKIGILIAIVGTFIVVIEPMLGSHVSSSSVFSRIYGNLLILIYSLGFAAYVILSKAVMGEDSSRLMHFLHHFKIKKHTYRYSPFMQTAISFYVALGFYTILMVLKQAFGAQTEQVFNISEIPLPALSGLLYMALFSGIAAYSVLNWGLHRATVSFSAIFSYLMPVFTLPFAYLMLGEIPSGAAIVGSAVIGLGIIIAEYKTNK